MSPQGILLEPRRNQMQTHREIFEAIRKASRQTHA